MRRGPPPPPTFPNIPNITMTVKIKDVVELIKLHGVTGASNHLTNSPLAAQSNHKSISTYVRRVKVQFHKLNRNTRPASQAEYLETNFVFPQLDAGKSHVR